MSSRTVAPAPSKVDDQGRATRAGTQVTCITTAHHWAIDVGLAARLDLQQAFLVNCVNARGSCHRSLTIGETKIGEQQLVESSPEVSGLALVGGFGGSEQGEPQ